jgi:hypothetical protein
VTAKRRTPSNMPAIMPLPRPFCRSSLCRHRAAQGKATTIVLARRLPLKNPTGTGVRQVTHKSRVPRQTMEHNVVIARAMPRYGRPNKCPIPPPIARNATRRACIPRTSSVPASSFRPPATRAAATAIHAAAPSRRGGSHAEHPTTPRKSRAKRTEQAQRRRR